MATLAPTEEKADCFRLQLLIVDVGTHVLRHMFDQIVHPRPLKVFLRTARGKLNELFRKRTISQEQWNLLYPPINEPNSETFDISLICCLLLNVCGLNVQSHPPGWIPSSMDVSKEADISRIRIMRNEIAHLKDMSVTKQQFQRRWQEMEQVMMRLGTGIPDLQQNIATIRNENLDPVKAKEYLKIIEEWEEMDKTIQSNIEDINTKLKKTQDDINSVKQELKSANTTSLEIGQTVYVHGEKINNVEGKQNEHSTRIDELDIESLQQRSQIEAIGSRQTLLEQDIKETSGKLTCLTERELHPRLQNLASVTELYIDDSARDDIYVETAAHEKAKTILTDTGCLILIGPPGEGKTTMATKLISETSEKGSCIKLTLPSDWDNIDINKGMFDTIFIDDMFGAGALDDNLLNEWSLRSKDMEKAVKAKMIRLIITTRHYIFYEARVKLRTCSLFKDDKIQLLASFNLTESERIALIEKHLKNADRVLSLESIKWCNKQYEEAFTFPSHKYELPTDIAMFLQKQGSIKAMIGFPEIATLFANNENLFKHRIFFFSDPSLFFKKCIEELYIDDEKFLVLILMWTRKNKQLHLESIQPHNISEEIKQTALKFGIDLKGKIISVLIKSVKYHKNGFIQFDQYTGLCSFTHNTVKDMVGLVAGQSYPNAVIEFADKEFLMQFVTTDKAKNDGFHIFIDEYQYDDLIKAILRHMKDKPVRSFLCFTAKKRDYEIQKNFGRAFFGFVFPGELNIDTSILSHDCFNQYAFAEKFFNCEDGMLLMTKPVEILPNICTDCNCNIDFGNFLPVYLPSLALLYKHRYPLKTFLERKGYQLLNETLFFRTTLLIASHQGMKDVIEILLKNGAVVCRDAIYFASAKGHHECLECLLKNSEIKDIDHSNNIGKNSPLIAAAKCGSAQCIKLLLQNHADINYRNKNGWSALDKAVLGYQTEACKILLENNANVNCKTRKYKRTPLHISADMCMIDITELLLSYGASVLSKDYRGHNPIHCAAFRGWYHIVELLLNADVSKITCKRRISYGKNSLIKGADLFHVAVYKNDWMLVDLLLKFNLNPNLKDFYGQTPFYRALANSKHRELGTSCDITEGSFDGIMKEVLDVIFKARPLKTDRSKFGNEHIIRSLLPVADVREPEQHGYTPLHTAVHKGLKEVVKLLCPRVNVNAQDKYGKTPLHTACEQLDLDMFIILVKEFNADYRMVTKSGQTIFDILQKKTSWKSICRRYRDKKPVEIHMVEKPPFKSFRSVIAAIDPEFAEQNNQLSIKQFTNKDY